jgi:alpha-2-macroglobulin
VIGSGNGAFFSGETDLRGVFVAEGVRGQVTAVARKGSNQYAFHRGTTSIGPPPAPAAPNAPGAGQPPQQPAPNQADLQQNVRGLNSSNQERQLQRLEERYKGQDNGVKAKSAY